MLTENQVYLLNLLYSCKSNKILDSDGKSNSAVGKTVGDLVREMKSEIDFSNPNSISDFKTPGEMEAALNAIAADPTLSSMEIAAAQRTPGESLHFIVVTPKGQSPREAVVVYEGTTGGREWRDDFEGGGPTSGTDGVSTPVQQEMLKFYQENQDILSECDYVTTTGHSKGGNAAQYVAIMESGVDRCISFDGQGFSDEFMEKYADEVALRQDIIKNYCADGDYVDILLNHVGEQIYIKSTLPDGADLLFYHSPFAMLDMNNPENSMNRQTQQSAVTRELDKFINSYIRSLPPDQRKSALEMIGNLVAENFSGDGLDFETALRLLSEGSNPDQIGYLITYVFEYLEHEGSKELLKQALNIICPGMGNTIIEFYDLVYSVMDNPLVKAFLAMMHWTDGIKGHVLEFLGWLIGQDWFMGLLSTLNPEVKKIKDTISLLCKAIGAAYKYNGTHHIQSGKDKSAGTAKIADVIRVDFDLLENTVRILNDLAASLRTAAGSISRASGACHEGYIIIIVNASIRLKIIRNFGLLIGTPASVLQKLGEYARKYADHVEKLSAAVKDSEELCRTAEEKNVQNYNNLSGAITTG